MISLSNVDLFLHYLLEVKHLSPLLLSSTGGAGPYPSQLLLMLSTQKLSQKASRFYAFDIDSSTVSVNGLGCHLVLVNQQRAGSRLIGEALLFIHAFT